MLPTTGKQMQLLSGCARLDSVSLVNDDNARNQAITR
jgi:hypothetical protein